MPLLLEPLEAEVVLQGLHNKENMKTVWLNRTPTMTKTKDRAEFTTNPTQYILTETEA